MIDLTNINRVIFDRGDIYIKENDDNDKSKWMSDCDGHVFEVCNFDKKLIALLKSDLVKYEIKDDELVVSVV